MEYRVLKNPASPEALTVSDIGPSVGFAVIEDGKEIQSGRFIESTYYDGEEWIPANAIIDPDGEEKAVCMYETGVVCSRSGKWANSFVVRKALEG